MSNSTPSYTERAPRWLENHEVPQKGRASWLPSRRCWLTPHVRWLFILR